MLSDKKDSKMNLGGSVRINPTRVDVICVILLLHFNSGFSCVTRDTRHVPSAPVDSTQNTSSSSVDPSLRSQATVNLAELLSVAIAVAEAGGREVKAVREQADIMDYDTRDCDPKTDGDMRSYVQMFYGLKKRFPYLNIISNEHDTEEVDTSKVPMASLNNYEVKELLGQDDIKVRADDVAVWIDPLDATMEYEEKSLEYVTTMVCVAVKGIPTLGIIRKPFGDDGTPRTV